MNPTDSTLNFLPFYQLDTVSASPSADIPFAGVAMMDSVFAAHTPAEQRTSMFAGQALNPVHGVPVERAEWPAPAWLFVLLLALASILVVYYRRHTFKPTKLTTTLVSAKAMSRSMRANNMQHWWQLMPAALLLTACVATALWRCMGLHPLWLAALWGGLSAAYLLRNLLLRLLGNAFGGSDAMDGYLASNYHFHLGLATVLIPMLFIMVYMPGAAMGTAKSMAVVAAVEFVLRVARGTGIFFSRQGGSHIHLFYYLCTVELVPILLFVKQFMT
ncbi:MAG: DUF4271 domain-containing protein [Bacteroidales bacterium]|nr:DUF4271 domain-containing protein [Bacteroidales bacterium]